MKLKSNQIPARLAILAALLIVSLASADLSDAQTRRARPGSTAYEGETVFLRGKIVDADGNPVPNALLYFHPLRRACLDKQISAQTDGDGEFTFACPKPYLDRDLQLLVLGPDSDRFTYGPWNRDASVSPMDYKTITVHDCPKFRTITGTVEDEKGRPVAEALVGPSGTSSFSRIHTRTDESGSFEFPYIGPGPMDQLYAVKEGVGFAYIATTEPDDGEGEPSPEEIFNGPFRFVLPKSRTVRVQVTDEKGAPIPRAVVSAAITTADKATRRSRDHFLPADTLSNLPFFRRADEKGVAIFDWIPVEGVKVLEFTARGPRTPVMMKDGSSKRFGSSKPVRWNHKDKTVRCVLTDRVGVKVRQSGPDESVSANKTIFIDW